MKTAEEWDIEFGAVNEGGTFKVESVPDFIRLVQRDAWEAACKAQIERTWGNGAAAKTVTPAPFPGETK